MSDPGFAGYDSWKAREPDFPGKPLEPTYAMSVRRVMPNGEYQEIAWDGYGLLQELTDAILDDARRRGWFDEPEESA